ncbi:uncharacterized protein LY79DRAFT_545879 [Colletotrichum navitas]|uniref:Uncharacterized protein n=1 Tax=Colletotrichum navitas TaxID=681940 RepID=A0AAD8Q518_9PEZI|nr:uncharacterized protein LY79DRAFT_545879 [Colletotrichum navitas]KAK1595735.1 hypothetical protein LY79DRAFT_545879 [Colletotrichum navitas]
MDDLDDQGPDRVSGRRVMLMKGYNLDGLPFPSWMTYVPPYTCSGSDIRGFLSVSWRG